MILLRKYLQSPKQTFIKTGLAILLMTNASASFGVVYIFPGNITAPAELLATDILGIVSGTMQTANNSTVNYTVAMNEDTEISLLSGSALSYDSRDGFSAILGVGNGTGLRSIVNSGSISNGRATYLIYHNDTIPSANYSLRNFNSMYGDISLLGIDSLDFRSEDNAQSFGNIAVTANTSVMYVGFANPATYTANGSISGIQTVNVDNASTFTVTGGLFNLLELTTSTGSTTNIYNSLNSIDTVTDGAITNNGILNMYGSVNKYGTFETTATGRTNFFDESFILTSNYDATAGTHGSNLYDIYTYGLTYFTAATPDFGAFAVTYTGGYFAEGTYNLVIAPVIGINPTSYTVPTPTMFLSFATPTVVQNAIQIALTRTPFQTYLSDGLSHRIATILETVGANNPSQAMVNLLDGLEKSANAEQLNNNIYTLLPLMSAPMYTFMLQDQAFEQVSLRVAETKQRYNGRTISRPIYSSGEARTDYTIWFRAIGDRAEQNPTGNTTGYYANTAGGVMGIDKSITPTFLLGAALSATQSTVDDKVNIYSYTRIKSYQVMLYSSVDMLPAYLNMAAAIANNKYNAVRNVNFNQYEANSTGAYGNHQYGAKIEYGVNYRPRSYVQVTPEGSVLYSYGTAYRYEEGGGDGTDLFVLADGAALAQFAAGFRFAFPFMQNSLLWIPELHIKGLYNISNGTQNMTSNFLGGGGQFITRAGLPKTGIRFGAAITLAKIHSLDLKLNYDHTAMQGYKDNMFYLNFRYSI